MREGPENLSSHTATAACCNNRSQPLHYLYRFCPWRETATFFVCCEKDCEHQSPRRRVNERDELEQRLRYRLVGLIHAGHIQEGDRLPSIRQTARETGHDHRAVAEAYRALEQDGVVEIRPGSGVYVAGTRRVGGVPSENVLWLAEVLMGGWGRRLSRMDIFRLVRSCTESRLRCACVESNEDHMVAVAAELEEDFDLDVSPVYIEPAARRDDVADEQLTEAELIVTTAFHAEQVREIGRRVSVPVVVVTINKDFAAALDRLLTRHSITAVVVDPEFAARGEAHLNVTAHRGRVRWIRVDQLDGEQVDLGSEAVALSRAARRRLGMEEYHFIPPPPPLLSMQSARELCETIARLSLLGAAAEASS